MPRWTESEDDWDEEFDPDDDWDEASDPDEGDENAAAADEDEPTVTCPYCCRQIHEDAVSCPYCEQYISEEDAPPGRKPWWIVVGVLLGLYVVYRWIAL